MEKLVGVCLYYVPKICDFRSGHFVLQKGDFVVVEVEHGLALGKIVYVSQELDTFSSEDHDFSQLKKIYRLATESDLKKVLENRELEKKAYVYCLQRIKVRSLDIKLIKVEYLFDQSKIIFYFSADGRLDFRDLVRDLAANFQTRVEMRQIGVRHEAKLLGGIGPCGRKICCSSFFADF